MLSKVYEEYVAPGRLELVFLDFPIPSIHPRAFAAAEAAHCAGEQDRFWEMHHQLFASQHALGPADLSGYAEELGLNVLRFEACLDKHEHAPAIREDARLVSRLLKVTSTPAYALGRRIPDTDKVRVLETLRGLPTYDAVAAKIDKLLGAN